MKGSDKQWDLVGRRHHHGLCTPLFSLHSEESCGIGEYTDLIKLLPFLEAIGFDVLQLLPLNDTGEDPSPYMGLSAFALNPIHLGLSQLQAVDQVPQFQEKLKTLRAYNKSPRVNYREVRTLKMAFLKEYYAHTFEKLATDEYYQFLQKQHYWLENYALFKALKEKQGGKNWEEWPEEERNPQNVQKLMEENREAMRFHSFCQYLCFLQLAHVKKAAGNKFLIKGDIPILVSRDSAEVWGVARHHFILDKAAGSPPDMYAQEGQYWGFPLYNWKELEKCGFDFWKQRLNYATELYHLYRLDHVVGFFRLWSIPLQKKALEGSFLPSEEKEWIPLGRKILEMMLDSSSMLPIAEDLGTVPPSVRRCLSALGIPGTKVMRWERRWEEDRGFIPTTSYPPESMTTVSTHDSETLQIWWRDNPEEARLYAQFKGWDYAPTLSLEHHGDILKESHHSGSLFHINLLQEYLALVPELGSSQLEEERINIPGKILETNWTYRYRPSIEALLHHTALKEILKRIV